MISLESQLEQKLIEKLGDLKYEYRADIRDRDPLEKSSFEVINQLRLNTDYSHHRYDVVLLINGVPCAQIELKTLGINPAGQWSRSSITRKTP